MRPYGQRHDGHLYLGSKHGWFNARNHVRRYRSALKKAARKFDIRTELHEAEILEMDLFCINCGEDF